MQAVVLSIDSRRRDGARRQLDAHSLGAGRSERQGEHAHATVDVDDQRPGSVASQLAHQGHQTFGLRRVGLKEGLHADAKAQAANGFGDVVLATKSSVVCCKGAEVSAEARMLRTTLTTLASTAGQAFGHGGRRVEGSRAGDNAKHGFPRASALAHHQLTQQPLMGTRVVQRQIRFSSE